MQKQSRRLKVLWLDLEYVVDVLSGMRQGRYLRFPVFPTLPDDVKYVDAAYSWERNQLGVRLSSETWPEVADGDTMPSVFEDQWETIDVSTVPALATRQIVPDTINCPACGSDHVGGDRQGRAMTCMTRQLARAINEIQRLKLGMPPDGFSLELNTRKPAFNDETGECDYIEHKMLFVKREGKAAVNVVKTGDMVGVDEFGRQAVAIPDAPNPNVVIMTKIEDHPV